MWSNLVNFVAATQNYLVSMLDYIEMQMKKVNDKKSYRAMSENIDTHPWDVIGTFEKLGYQNKILKDKYIFVVQS